MPSSCHPPVTVSQMIPRDDDVENCGRTTISRRGKGGRKPLSSPPKKRGRRICFEEAPPESPPLSVFLSSLARGERGDLRTRWRRVLSPIPPFSPNEESCNFSLSSSIPPPPPLLFFPCGKWASSASALLSTFFLWRGLAVCYRRTPNQKKRAETHFLVKIFLLLRALFPSSSYFFALGLKRKERGSKKKTSFVPFTTLKDWEDSDEVSGGK